MAYLAVEEHVDDGDLDALRAGQEGVDVLENERDRDLELRLDDGDDDEEDDVVNAEEDDQHHRGLGAPPGK